MWTRKAIILAKKETTYGTDIVPVAATNAIMCSEPQIKAIGKRLDRNYSRATLSPVQHLMIGETYEVSFTTEIKASGTEGTAPEIGPLFEGCGMFETIVASTSVAYDPISESFDSLSIYFHRDGLLHKILGARGTFQASLESGQFGTIKWTFQGLYVGPADIAYPSPTYNAQLPPKCIAGTFTMGGYTPIATKLEVNIGNSFGRKDDINATLGIKEVIINGRDPKGSFNPEVVTIATKDFWTAWNAATVQALSCLVGATGGNKYTISGPKCIYDEVGYGDRDGVAVYEIPFSMAMDSGDDELQILFT